MVVLKLERGIQLPPPTISSSVLLLPLRTHTLANQTHSEINREQLPTVYCYHYS